MTLHDDTPHKINIASSERAAHNNSAPGLTSDHARAVILARFDMLASIEHDISGPLRDALAQKITHEEDSLAAFIVDEAKTADAKRRSNKVLPSEHFVQRPLEAHLF